MKFITFYKKHVIPEIRKVLSSMQEATEYRKDEYEKLANNIL